MSSGASGGSASARKNRTEVKKINLALQGGGAHAAFTWGVLDRFLEDERLELDGISATSAGAMNAAVVAYGFIVGGRAGARKALADFWRRTSHASLAGPLQPSMLDRLMGNHSLTHSPAFVALDLMSRLASPYEMNPFNWNPLRDVISACVDFEALRTQKCPFNIYLSATNVRTGKVKVFDRSEVSAEAVMASACVPFLFQAVEVDGEHYWDGGYMGNPALFPLIHGAESPDIVVIHVNPLYRPDVPKSATEIFNRINEISFNASLMREMRGIAFVTELIESGKAKDTGLRPMNIHAIAADEVMADLGVASKLNADWDFLTQLRDEGRARADGWLEANFSKIGVESTIDIRATYL